jgi:hypothetical protein
MVRKSRGLYFTASFKMPALRRQDLIDIEKEILEQLKPQEYHLACWGDEYDRVDEISSESDTAFTFVVHTHSPCLRLKLARSWAELYCEESGEGARAVAHKISDIVRRREQALLWRSCKIAVWLAPTLGCAILSELVILIAWDRIPFSAIYPGLAFFLITYAWWIFSYRTTLFRFSRVTFRG